MKLPYNRTECETILQWRCEKSNFSHVVKMHRLISAGRLIRSQRRFINITMKIPPILLWIQTCFIVANMVTSMIYHNEYALHEFHFKCAFYSKGCSKGNCKKTRVERNEKAVQLQEKLRFGKKKMFLVQFQSQPLSAHSAGSLSCRPNAKLSPADRRKQCWVHVRSFSVSFGFCTADWSFSHANTLAELLWRESQTSVSKGKEMKASWLNNKPQWKMHRGRVVALNLLPLLTERNNNFLLLLQ